MIVVVDVAVGMDGIDVMLALSEMARDKLTDTRIAWCQAGAKHKSGHAGCIFAKE
jgi:hypothetical protein